MGGISPPSARCGWRMSALALQSVSGQGLLERVDLCLEEPPFGGGGAIGRQPLGTLDHARQRPGEEVSSPSQRDVPEHSVELNQERGGRIWHCGFLSGNRRPLL